jgi:type I restriction enzyme, R subunit
MVFCEKMVHAALVRDRLQALLGPETGKDLYAVRIVSEEHHSQALLEQFQLFDSTEPVVATTVDLLTTGVNVPAVRNIVFMKRIGSPTVFKQIIGRGSRLDETTRQASSFGSSTTRRRPACSTNGTSRRPATAARSRTPATAC